MKILIWIRSFLISIHKKIAEDNDHFMEMPKYVFVFLPIDPTRQKLEHV